ncbi:hypothetical protein B0H67DRAFT_570819 [Lasiosphaeris hirsuta]|uniref:G domain-containing protein n=1 Tax=Lasiosphaeris hirsuta TaxID=260670 RepID=A0AA40B0R7_9PEZI|nr:hypothetical protein B0H67DRAFT_570819 [Lasiosphaeris hirsuta]
MQSILPFILESTLRTSLKQQQFLNPFADISHPTCTGRFRLPLMVSSSVVILLIGLHGTGKSTFTKAATGHDVELGKGLVETTKKCGRYTFERKVNGSSRQFTIIDTPGLADRKSTDENLKILQDIANELRELGQEQVSGVIYFHSIESPKFDGIHKDNICVLKAICGKAFFSRVAFVTTRWNFISKEAYRLHESKHRQFEKEFQSLLPGTPPTFKFLTDGKSHIPLLEYLAGLNSPDHQLQFARELELYMSQHRKSKKSEVKKSEVKKTTRHLHVSIESSFALNTHYLSIMKITVCVFHLGTWNPSRLLTISVYAFFLRVAGALGGRRVTARVEGDAHKCPYFLPTEVMKRNGMVDGDEIQQEEYVSPILSIAEGVA